MINKFISIEEQRAHLERSIFKEVIQKILSNEIKLRASVAGRSPLAWYCEVLTFIKEAVDLHIVNEQRSDIQIFR